MWSAVPVAPAFTVSGVGGEAGAAAPKGLMTYAFTHGESSLCLPVHPSTPPPGTSQVLTLVSQVLAWASQGLAQATKRLAWASQGLVLTSQDVVRASQSLFWDS